MKILFVARALNNMAGGVERMIITISNELAARGHAVSLMSWDTTDSAAFYDIRPSIAWHKVNVGNPQRKATLAQKFERAQVVRNAVRSDAPDLIVCFQGGIFKAMLLYTAGQGIPIVAAERNAPTLYDYANSPLKRFTENLSYRFARRLLVQFDRFREMYPPHLRSRIAAVPNPVPPAIALAKPDVPGPNGRFTLLSVGRLGYQKNFDALLDAFALLADEHSEWDLRIVGEGEDRVRLEERIRTNPVLNGRVILAGTTRNVEQEYLAAHLFCLPSRWEGFPNALAEAFAHGMPCVGYADCAGTTDLIAHEVSGLLAEGNGNPRTLADALSKLMAQPESRKTMGLSGKRSVAQFAPDKVFDLWEQTLLSCHAH